MMESVKHGKSSAPYGEACAPCVKAKSRCMLREGTGCERCHRLGKECFPSSSVRKKRAKKSITSKRAQLEDKLDDLASILRTQSVTSQQDPGNLEAITMRSPDLVTQPNGRGAMCSQFVTEEELIEFRGLHLPHFPLVYLPSNISAEQLNHEKPLLSLTIKTICNKAYSVQTRLSKKLRKMIALKMMVDGEKSLDLLLSVLACMTWSIYFTFGKQFLGMLAGLARSLVSDLELDNHENTTWSPIAGAHERAKAPRSNESRRAHIACFALSVMISTTLKYDMMQWSTQLEQDCSQLFMEKEAHGDAVLISMARIARICQQVADVKRQLNGNNYVHGTLHIEPFLSSLDELRRSFSEELSIHSSIAALDSIARLSIYELALLDSTTQAILSDMTFDHRRTSHLTACLQLCKQFTKQYLNLDFIAITTPTSFAFAYSLRNLYKLATLADAGWHPTIVVQAVDLVELLDLCAASADRVNAELKEKTGEDSVFAMAARSVKHSAPPNWRVPNTEPQSDGVAVTEGWIGTGGLDVSFVDFSDEFWLNTVFCP